MHVLGQREVVEGEQRKKKRKEPTRLTTELAEATPDGLEGRTGCKFGPVDLVPLSGGDRAVQKGLGGGEDCFGEMGQVVVPMEMNNQPYCINLMIEMSYKLSSWQVKTSIVQSWWHLDSQMANKDMAERVTHIVMMMMMMVIMMIVKEEREEYKRENKTLYLYLLTR